MKQLKPLTISLFVILFLLTLFISPLKTIAQLSKEVIIDAIFLNNEQVILDSKDCKLELKYNDVIKLVGRAEKNAPIYITFAEEKYTDISDEMGNWMVIFSIPYIEDGRYEITQEGSNDSYCEIKLNNPNEDNTQEKEDKNSKSIYIIVLLSIISLSFGSYVFLSKKKKHRR